MVKENERIDIERTSQLLGLKARIDDLSSLKFETCNADFNKLQESLSNLALAGREVFTKQKNTEKFKIQ